MTYIINFIIGVVGKLIAPIIAFKAGGISKENETLRENEESIIKAKKARDKLRCDAAYAEWLRKKYTR